MYSFITKFNDNNIIIIVIVILELILRELHANCGTCGIIMQDS